VLSRHVNDGFGQSRGLALFVHADPCGMAIMPGAFDKHSACGAVSSFGDAATIDGVASRPLGWHQTKVGHELARVSETAEIADLGQHGGGRYEANPAHGLDRLDDRHQRPTSREFGDGQFDAGEPLQAVADSAKPFLQHEVMGVMFEALLREPTQVSKPSGPRSFGHVATRTT
jgi:hypothetical protein